MVTGLLLAGLAASSVSPARAEVLHTQDEVLRKAWPEVRAERRSVFLTPAQMQAVEALGGQPLESGLLTVHDLYEGDRLVGHSYLDAHQVRTLPETLLLAVDTNGCIRVIDVLVFREPQEYRPARRWYDQFLNKRLNDDLQLKRDIHGVTGATLTSRATMRAVRRLLAVHAVLRAPPAGAP